MLHFQAVMSMSRAMSEHLLFVNEESTYNFNKRRTWRRLVRTGKKGTLEDGAVSKADDGEHGGEGQGGNR